MKVIDLLNKIANGEIKDKTKFRINWGDMYRDFYYDNSEENQLQCLKNCSDNYSLYDDIRLNDEVEILEEEKKIPEKLTDILRVDDLIPPVDENMYKIWTQIIKNHNKINEICDYLKSKGE